jgi:hypothetical protein
MTDINDSDVTLAFVYNTHTHTCTHTHTQRFLVAILRKWCAQRHQITDDEGEMQEGGGAFAWRVSQKLSIFLVLQTCELNSGASQWLSRLFCIWNFSWNIFDKRGIFAVVTDVQDSAQECPFLCRSNGLVNQWASSKESGSEAQWFSKWYGML